MSLPLSAKVLATGFTVSGVVHLVRPQVFEPLMPAWVPAHRELIYASGVAELACAAGMALPATRKVAAYASVAVLLGVFPGNVQMAQDAMRTRNTRFKAIALGRLPMQLPMIRAALKAARA
ncbi:MULTISPECIES: DoxX family protein [unclassified Nocardioides]|uniref:DoxX family protein n=1 Tax=unclassified Nocardioides TaxID=2615069 RepID=UPI0026659B7C|nr:DoxX family protein [Nocardioides sp. Arc9.136]WKN49961.1 DoxX family protein [Nocardioides sp. Arc9.136]